MDKTTQDLAWSILPKEFKEKVKRKFQLTDANCIAYEILIDLFGIHNLTSDAEGEEMLTCDRDVVRMLYDRTDSVKVRRVLDALFGSKCLPDEVGNEDNFSTEEPKPAEMTEERYQHLNSLSLEDYDNETSADEQRQFCEYQHKHHPDEVEWLQTHSDDNEPEPSIPKFKHKLGDKVRIVNDWSHGYKHNGEVTEIVAIDESDPEVPYKVDIYDEEEGGGLWYSQSDLEPYTGPKDEITEMKPIEESHVSVYLATEEEDAEFRLILHKNGFKWRDGASLIRDTHWSSLIEETKIYYLHPDKTVIYYGHKTSDTLTFSEFKKQYFVENVNLSQGTANCDKHSNNTLTDTQNSEIDHIVQDHEMVDNIIKDGFAKERRLNIAAQMAQSILRNNDEIYRASVESKAKTTPAAIAEYAFALADALLAECEKKGGQDA